MLSCSSTAVNDSMGVAIASSPAFSGRMLGILATISLVSSTADSWSEQMSTSLSMGWRRSPSSLAGTWCSAAATLQCGTAACTLAATEPRGGTNGWNSLPSFVRALAIDTTTLPRRWSSTDTAVCVAPSHGVAITTTSVSAAWALLPAPMVRLRSDHCSSWVSTTSIARYLDRDPTTTSNPTEARRAASALPAGPVPPRMPMRTGDTVVARAQRWSNRAPRAAASPGPGSAGGGHGRIRVHRCASAGLDLEVQVGGPGIARLSHIADDGAGRHPSGALVLVAGEVRAVVRGAVVAVHVPGQTAERAGAVLDRAAHRGDGGRATGGHHVGALVAAPAGAGSAPGVDEVDGTGDGAHDPAAAAHLCDGVGLGRRLGRGWRGRCRRGGRRRGRRRRGWRRRGGGGGGGWRGGGGGRPRRRPQVAERGDQHGIVGGFGGVGGVGLVAADCAPGRRRDGEASQQQRRPQQVAAHRAATLTRSLRRLRFGVETRYVVRARGPVVRLRPRRPT